MTRRLPCGPQESYKTSRGLDPDMTIGGGPCETVESQSMASWCAHCATESGQMAVRTAASLGREPNSCGVGYIRPLLRGEPGAE